MKTTLIAFAALAAFIIAPTAASAGESAPSYSAKKQGRVVFQKTQDAAAAKSTPSYDASNPANIEPAAGGFEQQNPAQQRSVANKIKLPRKF